MHSLKHLLAAGVLTAGCLLISQHAKRIASMSVENENLSIEVQKVRRASEQLFQEIQNLNRQHQSAASTPEILELRNVVGKRVKVKAELAKLRRREWVSPLQPGGAVDQIASSNPISPDFNQRLYSRQFKISTHSFMGNVREALGMSRDRSLEPAFGAQMIPARSTVADSHYVMIDLLKQNRVELKEPKRISVNDREGSLVVLATSDDLEIVQRLVDRYNQ